MRTRFAPSPTGPLHLGHAFSALTAANLANAADGTFLLRIEDIDQSRARPEWEALIYDDLAWLGLAWPLPVMRQSDRMNSYRQALDDLWQRRLLFACTCTRRDIEAATSAPQEGVPLLGPDGIVYPGTCRHRKRSSSLPYPPTDCALRLDMEAAVAALSGIDFTETGIEPAEISTSAQDLIEDVGDVVLSRRDMGTSYHLSVVLDDAFQSITHVTRGLDLFEATAIHVVLQRLLDLPTPIYHHHTLVRDEAGKRLAKRDDARAIRAFREDGLSPGDVRAMLPL